MKTVIIAISASIGAILSLIALFVGLFSLFSPNSLGAYDERQFSTSQSVIENALDSFYIAHPEHKVPQNWQQYDNWAKGKWSYENSYMFYFDSQPEELLYVTFIKRSDSNICMLAVRAVNSGTQEWEKAHHTFPSFIQNRVSKRFNEEIISEIERIANVKSTERID